MTALQQTHYELRITMEGITSSQKIEMISGEQMDHSEKSETKKEMSIVFSPSEIEVMKALCPKGIDFEELMKEKAKEVLAMSSAERVQMCAEYIKKISEKEEDREILEVSMLAMQLAKEKDEAEMKEKEEDENEDEEPEDRWDCPREGHEADCVADIKKIIYELKQFNFIPENNSAAFRTKCSYTFGDERGSWGICSTQIDPTPANCSFRAKLDFAFQAWLMLHNHKLNGSGGNWCSGCFGSFWADIALTIPELRGRYFGIRVSFNPNPCHKYPGWFLLDIDDEAEFKMSSRQSSACHPNYGPCLDWGKMLMDQSRYEIRELAQEEIERRKAEAAARKAEKKAKEAADAAKQAAKEAKAAKLREEEAERRRIDKEIADKRAAERAAREEEERKVREAEFAARVAAVAEREKQNAEALKAAKAEKARIAEENAKLKKEAAEAARKAKYGPKK